MGFLCLPDPVRDEDVYRGERNVSKNDDDVAVEIATFTIFTDDHGWGTQLHVVDIDGRERARFDVYPPEARTLHAAARPAQISWQALGAVPIEIASIFAKALELAVERAERYEKDAA